VGYVSKEEYREGIDGVIAFLSGRFRQIERELEDRMHWHSGEQDYETAALERNRLQAVRALLERQRVANEGAGTYDAVAVDVEGPEANAQVFQVRDGVLADRQSFYLENEAGRDEGEVAEEFILQYYASAIAVPPQVVVQRSVEHLDVLAEALTRWLQGGDEAGHGVDRAALLERLGNSNKRAAVETCFHHQKAVAPAADDAVAQRDRT
jgi:excinuclease ABC subunit C